MFVFKTVLKQLYTNGSLRNTDEGFRFELKNRLLDARLTGVRAVRIDGRDVPLDGAHLVTADGRVVTPNEVSSAAPLRFDLGDTFDVRLRGAPLSPGPHAIAIAFDAEPFGALTLDIEDSLAAA
jgi:hydroxymethylglutaryl-CoA reductase (NADPH)